MIDSYRHKGLRKKLIAELRNKGIKNEKVLKVMANLPRHFFLDVAFDSWAYKDVAFPIDADQTISQPYTVAFQTNLIDVQKSDKILEVGTGSGYQAAILHLLGAKVYTIERQQQLFTKTSERLIKLGFPGIRTLFGDGYQGAPRFAPYDKILVTAGSRSFPEKLFDQLKPGGYMVIPIGDRKVQKMERYTKLNSGEYKKESFGSFSFVPMLTGVNAR